jgi:hypothetical protein
VTTGSGDPRVFGGAPLFGDPAKAAAPRSTVMPGSTRPGEDSRPSGSSGSPSQADGGSAGSGSAGSGSAGSVGGISGRPSSPPPSGSAASSTVVPDAATQRRPVTVGTAPMTRKKGRRARLTIKRIDPWTTLKFSFVYGLAGLVVLLVAVVVLYGVVDAMGVISSVRNFLGDVQDSTGATTSSGSGLGAWLGFGRVMLVTIVIGLINVVLFTAFATLTAFIYNVCTDIVGGVEITLAERN